MRSSYLPGAVARAATLGFTAGLRSQVPLALLARHADQVGPALLNRRGIRAGLYLSAAGELVGDKLPMVPSRLTSGPLFGRLLIGSIAGALLAGKLRSPAIVGVFAGAAGALAGSHAGYHSRVWLGEVTGLPDPVWAVLEDGVAITLGVLATRDRSSNTTCRGCL